MRRYLTLLFCSLSLLAAGQGYKRYLPKAKTILATTPIVDTHIDFPEHLMEWNKWYQPGYTGFSINNPQGNFDYTRARAGGLYGAFMSIYIPAKYQKTPGRPRQLADSLINMVHAIVRTHPKEFALAMRADDVMRNFENGIVSLPMGMENGAPIDKPEDLTYFHDRGIRYITLTHSRDNRICDSSYDTLHTHHGLSDFGRTIVKEMNRVGIMVDVSHLSDEAIWDVLEVAQKPLIATHSGCRYFTPGFERNLPDTLIVAIAKTGGVVQVPFSQYFLTSALRKAWKAADAAREAQKVPEFGVEAVAFYKKFGKKHGEPYWASVREVADQIDHIKNLVGIDHIGIGSDFDGVGYALPRELNGVDKYPVLLAELLRRGYSEEDIRKICSGNVLRVWKANE